MASKCFLGYTFHQNPGRVIQPCAIKTAPSPCFNKPTEQGGRWTDIPFPKGPSPSLNPRRERRGRPLGPAPFQLHQISCKPFKRGGKRLLGEARRLFWPSAPPNETRAMPTPAGDGTDLPFLTKNSCIEGFQPGSANCRFKTLPLAALSFRNKNLPLDSMGNLSARSSINKLLSCCLPPPPPTRDSQLPTDVIRSGLGARDAGNPEPGLAAQAHME